MSERSYHGATSRSRWRMSAVSPLASWTSCDLSLVSIWLISRPCVTLLGTLCVSCAVSLYHCLHQCGVDHSNNPLSCCVMVGRKEMFYLTMHSTHFIYGYMEGRKELFYLKIHSRHFIYGYMEGRKCFI